MKIYKIGLIGCGHVAVNNHVGVILGTPGLSLHALYDPYPHAFKAIREDISSTRCFTDIQAFFNSGLDAVVITSPASVHKDNILSAIRHGLPILCEKPLVMNQKEGDEILKALEENPLPVYTAFCYRFSPVALAIRKMVSNQTIGNVRSLRLIYNWNLHGKYILDPQGVPQIQQRRLGRMKEGGPMIDCGTHQIDLSMFWLRSPVVQFSGHGAWVEDYEAPDHMWLHMDHENRAHTCVEISYSYHQVSETPRMEFVYELIGTEGVIRYDRSEKSFTVDTAEGHRELEFFGEKNFAGMYEEFHRALSTGKSALLPDIEHSLQVTDIAMRGTLEAIEKKVVRVDRIELT